MTVPATVVIVDNDRHHANAVREQLRSIGFEAVHQPTGAEAIDYVFGERPHVLLVSADLGDGLDGAATAASIQSRLDVPVIFLIRPETPAELRARLERRNAVVIPKPCTKDRLVDALERVARGLFPSPGSAAET
jgi:DNA-binding response OmpR family regulator